MTTTNKQQGGELPQDERAAQFDDVRDQADHDAIFRVGAYAPKPALVEALDDRVSAYKPGRWFDARTIDEMQAFYMSRLPAIRAAAQEHGYAIGLHGSTRRDFDIMAMQWRADASDKDSLARAIADAACGIRREGSYEWEKKPSGRVATSLPICWTDHGNPDFDDMVSAGHIDLSLIDTAPAPAASVPDSGRDAALEMKKAIIAVISYGHSHSEAPTAKFAKELLGAIERDDRVAKALATHPANGARAVDAEEDAYVIDRMGKLLAGVAIALKGPEKALHRHGYQDLVEVAQTLILELELYRDHVGVQSGAAYDVLAERRRQIEKEGFVPADDDAYVFGELRSAALCYISGDTKSGWPWDKEWWKPTDDRHDLIKAGALIIAEIERLDRSAPQTTEKP